MCFVSLCVANDQKTCLRRLAFLFMVWQSFLFVTFTALLSYLTRSCFTHLAVPLFTGCLLIPSCIGSSSRMYKVFPLFLIRTYSKHNSPRQHP